MRFPRVLLLALAALLPPAGAGAQQGTAALHLRIVSYETGAPVAGARVSLPAAGLAVASDQAGRAELSGISPGTHLVSVETPGYAVERMVVQLHRGQTVRAEVALVPGGEPVEIEGIEVTARRGSQALALVGFHERQRRGGGTFLTRRELEGRGHLLLSDILRRVLGVRIVRNAREGVRSVATRSGPRLDYDGGGTARVDHCYMQLFLDGLLVPVEDVDDVPVSWIEGIEVYRGPTQVPTRFNLTGTTCGVVLIWTR